jgi:cytochrome P450
MENKLLLSSAMQDPYVFYSEMIAEHPAFYDDASNTWFIYSYACCEAILTHSGAHIPPFNPGNKDGLSDDALLLTGGMARLLNAGDHVIARQVTMQLFQQMQQVRIDQLTADLIQQAGSNKIDWVEGVCKKLPALAVLRAFHIDLADANWITRNMSTLADILRSHKTPAQVAAINAIAKDTIVILQKHLYNSGLLETIIRNLPPAMLVNPEVILHCCTSNLASLLIQSYDACRGILANALLHSIQHRPMGNAVVQQHVTETFRFDSPVQHTRRMAVEDILLNGVHIKKGQSIIIVLAAANHDPQKFDTPGVYNIGRINNEAHLSFGTGAHACVAKQFASNMATTALAHLFDQYPAARLPKQTLSYEPLPNVRLLRHLYIELH